MKFHLTSKKILFIILLFAALSRLIRLDYPPGYVFDEVYHAFTAKEYAKNHKEAWEWWTSPPPGVAYEWTHPPLAKEIMAGAILIFQKEDGWTYRLPGTLIGVLSIYIIYLLGKEIFKKESTALIASFIFSVDGLNFVQSRTGMNDIYFVTSMLISLLFLLKKRYIYSAIFFGLMISSKWTGIYFLAVLIILLIRQNNLHKIVYFLLFGTSIYLLTYIPFFLLGHSLDQFKQLQQQMWWYHTGLKATHDYSSAWWSWPLNLYPVWYFVDYQKDGKISNIFASGNPVVFWLGSASIILTIWDYFASWFKKTHFKKFISKFWEHFKDPANEKLLVVLVGTAAFWLPWAFSPRIMFLYHFSPVVPFISLGLAFQINQLSKEKNFKFNIALILITLLLGFILIYPMLTGIPLPKDLMQIFFRTNLTKNPFG